MVYTNTYVDSEDSAETLKSYVEDRSYFFMDIYKKTNLDILI